MFFVKKAAEEKKTRYKKDRLRKGLYRESEKGGIDQRSVERKKGREREG